MKTILGLDIATKTGYAVLSVETGQRIESGVLNCSIRTKATKTIPADHEGRRMWALEFGLYRLLSDHENILIAYERITMGPKAGGKTTAVARWMESVVLLGAYRENLSVISYAPGTIKKHATGDGRATKEQMVSAAEQRFSTVVCDDNEADALHIASLAHSQIGL